MDDFIPYHKSTNQALYITLNEQLKVIEDLKNQIYQLNSRLQYLENTFLPIPDEHEIMYEKVYHNNPLFPPNQDPPKLTLVSSPASNAEIETSLEGGSLEETSLTN